MFLVNFSGNQPASTVGAEVYTYPRWEDISNSTFTGKEISNIVAVSPDSLWLQANDGVYESIDQGNTWTKHDLPANTYKFVPASSTVGWALISNNGMYLYKTEDGAETWTEFPGLDISGSSVYDIIISSTGTVWLYGGTSLIDIYKIKSDDSFTYTQVGGIGLERAQSGYADGDDGLWLVGVAENSGAYGWTAHISNPDITNYENWTQWYDPSANAQGSFQSVLALDSDSAIAFADGVFGAFRTDNGGVTWAKFDDFGTMYNIESTTDAQSKDTIWVANQGAIYRFSDDGLSWHRQGQQIINGNLNLVATASASDLSRINVWAIGTVTNKIFRYSSSADATATKYKIILPGQAYNKDTGAVTGTPTSVKAGREVIAKIYATDDDGVLDTMNASFASFSSSNLADVHPADIQLTQDGTCSQSTPNPDVPCGVGTAKFIFHTPGATTISVSDPNGFLADSTSSPVTVTPGAEDSMYFTDGSTRTSGAGKPSSIIKVGFKDEFNTITTVDSGRTIRYSSSSTTGRFSSSENGPWTNVLDVPLGAGASDASAYFIDYVVVENSTITVSSSGLTNISLSAVTTEGDISPTDSTVTLSPTSLRLSERATITAVLKDNFGGVVTNKKIKFYSSRKSDTITNPASNTNSAGIATGSVVSNTPGELTISAFDETDGVWLRNQPKLTYLGLNPAIISAINSMISSNKTTLIIGKDRATISVVVQDQYQIVMPNVTVSLVFDTKYADISSTNSTTNDKGIAEFTLTPKKAGRVEIGAKAGDTSIDKKVTIEISEGSVVNQLQNSDIAQTIAHVLDPIVAVTAALGLIPLIASIISGAPAGLHALTYGISLSMEALGIRKRRKNWGRVYDSTTGKGVDLALVRLYNQQTMKLVGTIVTNLKGRYNFQPQPGTYVISVTKDGYIYPTQIFAQYGLAKVNKNATRIDSHYLGQPITITEKDNFLNLDIPIDPVAKTPSFLLKARIWAEDMLYLITFGLSYIFMPALIIGAVLSSFVAIVLPSTRNMVTAVVYLLITLIYALHKMAKSHQFSTVIDTNNKPIQGVMISIFDKKYNTLKESRITDRFGRFSIHAESGQYTLKAERRNYDFSPDNLEKEIKKNIATDKFRGQTINIKKAGYIRVTIIGKRN